MKKRLVSMAVVVVMLLGLVSEMTAYAAGPVWPLDRSKIQKEWKNWYSYVINGSPLYHAGTDFAIPLGNNVYATYDGIIDFAGWYDANHSKSYGLCVILRCTINGKTRYIYFGHLSALVVSKGQSVSAGQVIGKSGSTGFSTGPHLHYEVRNENKYYGTLQAPGLNPYDYLPGGSQTQTPSKVPTSPLAVSISSPNTSSDTYVGATISVNWSGATGIIDNYYATLICTTNSRFSESEKSFSYNSSKATFQLKNSGTYKISVRTKNSAGYSTTPKASNAIVAHANSTVTFNDYDGKLLASKSVQYGSNVTPSAPSRNGYTFNVWMEGSNPATLTNITSDKTFTAYYQINKYNVKFVDKDGNQIGATQSIPFGGSAIPPANPTVPTGYKFVGWDKTDYQFVKENITIKAVYTWANVDLPITASINSAIRNTDASGYTAQVKLSNFPNAVTKGKLITMLKTEAGKMVASETETFSLYASGLLTKDVFVPYSGIATVAEVSVVGIVDDGNTGVPIAQSVSKSIDLGLQWSDWSVNPPPSGDYVTESRTEYSYRDKSTTTSTASTMSGWTLYDSQITSWGTWSAWQNTSITANTNRQVGTQTIPATYKTVWKYNRYVYSNGKMSTYSSSMGGSYQAIQLDSRLTYYDSSYGSRRYGSYVYGGNTYLQKFWWNESSAQVQTAAAYTQYRYRNAIYTYYLYKWSDWSAWSPTAVTATANKEVKTRTTYRFKSNDIKVTAYNYKRYKYQNLTDGNYYYAYDPTYANSMGYPGEWQYNKTYAQLSLVATVDNNVSVYNGYVENSWYRADVNTLGNITQYITYDTLEDTTGTARTISGTLGVPGKKATIMVFKGTNSDPTASQLEYVSQTTLGTNGEYSFTFNPKEDPSLKTGDFIVMISVEGGTSPIYVDTISAPLPTYTVEFVDEDGTLIDKQTVIKGDSAVLPSSVPEKTGYDFTGWDTGITNIRDDLTITAQYKKKTYTVIFVDWENNDIEIKCFEHGDPLVGPDPAEKEGSSFVGWDAVLNGTTTVTDNMIVSAQYTLNNYTVKFENWDGSVIDEQVLEYGSEAVLPENPTLSGMVFAGWSDYYASSFVDQDAVIYPLFAYETTVNAPTASMTSGNYVGKQTVELNCSTPEAQIYYAVLDKEATYDLGFGNDLDGLSWELYSAPIMVDIDTALVFYAKATEMNDSEYVLEEYTITKALHSNTLLFNTMTKSNNTISGLAAIRINNVDDPVTNSIVLVVYEKTSAKLLGMKIKTQLLNAGNNDVVFDSLSFANATESQYIVKVFVWNSMDKLEPTGDVLIFNVQ